MADVLHFQDAVAHHHKWFEELIACLKGEQCILHPDDVVHHDRCAIGQWLHGAGQAFAHLEAFQAVMAHHGKVHDTAASALTAKEQSNHDLVEELLVQINELRHEMFMAWNDLNVLIGSYE